MSTFGGEIRGTEKEINLLTTLYCHLKLNSTVESPREVPVCIWSLMTLVVAVSPGEEDVRDMAGVAGNRGAVGGHITTGGISGTPRIQEEDLMYHMTADTAKTCGVVRTSSHMVITRAPTRGILATLKVSQDAASLVKTILNS